MGISFDPNQQLFHLQAKDTSYVFQVVKNGYLAHLYWGQKINHVNTTNWKLYEDRAFSPNPEPADRTFSLDILPQEFPGFGTSDLRAPAYQIQLADGTTITDLRYKQHRTRKGKPLLEGLPATYVEADNEAETLELELLDETIGLKVILSYTVFDTHNAITRSARFVNEGQQELKLLSALSMSVDFQDDDFDLLHLSGAWARERYVVKRTLVQGTQSIESRRGASSHQQNPFLALLRKDTTEDHGDVYGLNLVYSGNYLAQAEVDQYNTTRVTLGIQPFDFSWILEPSESFQTPEVVMVFSANGLGELSRTYHRLYRTRLIRGQYRDKERPILINNWEATYFNFNAEMIENIARTGKELGMELFVLDDGWFGKRNDDTTSLGDWIVNHEKLPAGLEDLVNRVRSMGMSFGLWFEPEMISKNSELYRAHPDWCLHVPDRSRSEGRNQLILDFSRNDVCEAVIQNISAILSSAPISYVKWDMNRHMTEVGSALLPSKRQRETAHRYILGVYRVMDTITQAFPNILFESCSGGGGRFDPGILYYMPQTWTSDNTDAISRLKIQYGTSIVYPAIAMGGHVSAIPNHQVHRSASLQTRGQVAMAGNFGYELDLTALTEAEKEEISRQVSFYKEHREIVQFGELYRLRNPFEGNDSAWMYASDDKKQALVTYCRVLAEPNAPHERLRLKGLDPTLTYRWLGTNQRFGGDELMYIGIMIPDLHGDFVSHVWSFRAEL